MTKLRPCPFCGGSDLDTDGELMIGCNTCNIAVKIWGWNTPGIEERWNRRAKE